MTKKIHRRRDTDPRDDIKKYGDATFADPVNKKYPIDSPGRIKAACAYIHQPANAKKYTAGELRTIRARIRAAAKTRKLALPHLVAVGGAHFDFALNAFVSNATELYTP